MEPDEDLIRRFRAGDQRAFEGLVARWNPTILRLAYRLTGRLDEARDVRQAALLRAYEGLPGLNGGARPSTWLFRVVVNLCRDGHRRDERRAHALHDAARNGDGAPRAEAAPEERSATREAAERVAAAVAALPSAEREVVVLRHYHDLPFPEIAAVLGAPVTTVKSRMARGLRSLRVELKELCP